MPVTNIDTVCQEGLSGAPDPDVVAAATAAEQSCGAGCCGSAIPDRALTS